MAGPLAERDFFFFFFFFLEKRKAFNFVRVTYSKIHGIKKHNFFCVITQNLLDGLQTLSDDFEQKVEYSLRGQVTLTL